MKRTHVKSIHFDNAYSCVLSSPKKLRLLVISGFNWQFNKAFIASFILIKDEKEDYFLRSFKTLRQTPYDLNQVYKKADFSTGQKKVFQILFPNILFTVFFCICHKQLGKKFQE